MEDTWDKNRGRREMRINKEECTGLVIDIQERLFPHMDQKEELLKKCSILIRGLNALKVPLVVTEQYPKGLGPTVSMVKADLQGRDPIEKISFSCCDEPAFMGAIGQLSRNTLIVSGIEAHVCILQTVVDLVTSGYSPVVVADCITSRKGEDKRWALERMRSEGATISTCESILFELARRAGTPEFKAISQLVK